MYSSHSGVEISRGAGADRSQGSGNGNGNGNGPDFVDRAQQWKEGIQSRTKQLATALSKEEVQECTFKPKVSYS
jgi:hypothetical protein